MLKRLFLNGIISGSLFGLIFKFIERFANKKVYTLLMNVDYFPFLKDLNLYEIVEFSLHLVVSVILVYVLYFGLKKLDREPYIWINILIGGLLYVTTTFSERTPELTDIFALTYWLAGHAIFGALVGIMIKFSR